jgi:hypothetical protein
MMDFAAARHFTSQFTLCWLDNTSRRLISREHPELVFHSPSFCLNTGDCSFLKPISGTEAEPEIPQKTRNTLSRLRRPENSPPTWACLFRRLL